MGLDEDLLVEEKWICLVVFGTVVVLINAALLLRRLHPALFLREWTYVHDARPRHLLVARQTHLFANGLLLLCQIQLSSLDRLPKIGEHLARINLAPSLPLRLLSLDFIEYLLLLVSVLWRLRISLQGDLPRLQRKLILARLLHPDAPIGRVFEHLLLKKSVEFLVGRQLLILVQILNILMVQ